MEPVLIAVTTGVSTTLLWVAAWLLWSARPRNISAHVPEQGSAVPFTTVLGEQATGTLAGRARAWQKALARHLDSLRINPFARRRERQRLRRFREQLPEALEVMARALRAGHAVPTSLAMVIEESVEPLRHEFTRVVEDLRFGKSLPEALKGLAARVPVEEVRFWVTCLLIQRETGGSLPQMLDEVSRLIRARMEFAAKIKAVSAEARFSALILSALPMVLACVIFLLNPDYLSPLWNNQVGRWLAATAVGLMGCGLAIMRRMTRITL
ncbi:MAG: type II secretion system F family protein [Nitrospira sp.]|nr:type II secretion system F family protein [Nitrospira sp.]MCP9442680.1 type II secretion system F family protein [Nitrospira sp.]